MTQAGRGLRVVLVCSLLSAGSGLLAHRLHREADAWRGPVQPESEARWMPTGRMLKLASLGFSAAMADLLWMRAVNLFGGNYDAGGDPAWLRWLYHLVDLVTDLDPRFRSAYLNGGIMLRVDEGWIAQSTMLFDKGARGLPDQWVFPFNIAMNYYLHVHDVPRAAEYMRRAAILPGSPFYLRNLAASMLDETRQLETALSFVEQELRAEVTPLVRTSLEVKQAELRHAIAARDLGDAASRYRRDRGQYPRHLRDLVPGWLPALPPDPLGGNFRLDRQTGVVASDRWVEWKRETPFKTGLGQRPVPQEPALDPAARGAR